MVYVGLQLAVEFGKKLHNTIGIDKSLKKIEQLRDHLDITNENIRIQFKRSNYA